MDEPRSAQRYLEDLTPGGSEFYNNPKRCYEWASRSLEETHRLLVKACLERNRLREENERLRAALPSALTGDVHSACQKAVDEIRRTEEGKTEDLRAIYDRGVKRQEAINATLREELRQATRDGHMICAYGGPVEQCPNEACQRRLSLAPTDTASAAGGGE